MKRDIRMIGLDIDGTVMQEFAGMTPRVRTAIQKALEAGMVVLPATGRQLSNVPQAFLEIPGIHYALTSNGAAVTDLEKNEQIYSDCFTKEKALEILDVLSRFDAVVGFYRGGTGYNQRLRPEFEQALPQDLLEYIRQTRDFYDDLAAIIREKDTSVEKFTLFFASQQERLRALSTLRQRDDICTTSSFSMNLEINTATANKGAGLLALGRLLGYTREQVMAIGDGLNDVEMLKTVGYGVAMGNAEPEVKAVADDITLSCAEDGVAVAIEALL